MNIDPNYPGLMSGPLAEQFVGQELLSTHDPLLEEKLFFWSRLKGAAEVDYLYSHKGTIYPIEVKAGKAGKLKSCTGVSGVWERSSQLFKSSPF